MAGIKFAPSLTTAVGLLKPHGLSAGFSQTTRTEWVARSTARRASWISIAAKHARLKFVLQLDVGTCVNGRR